MLTELCQIILQVTTKVPGPTVAGGQHMTVITEVNTSIYRDRESVYNHGPVEGFILC